MQIEKEREDTDIILEGWTGSEKKTQKEIERWTEREKEREKERERERKREREREIERERGGCKAQRQTVWGFGSVSTLINLQIELKLMPIKPDQLDTF